MKTLTGEEFSIALQQIYDDIYVAQHSWYTYLGIKKEIYDSIDLLRKLNEQPNFWKTTLHSLQQTFFITTYRLFDDSPDSYSIHKFANSCISNPQIFSEESLKHRKESAFENLDFWGDYQKDIFIPTIKDLRAIKTEVSKCRKLWEPTYKDIRNKIFAHKIIKDSQVIATRFSKTQTQDIDDLLYGLYDVYFNIRDLYQNGREFSFGKHQYDYQQKIEESVALVLNSLS